MGLHAGTIRKNRRPTDVSRILFATAIHLRDRYPRLSPAKTGRGADHAIVSYLVLLREGFALPPRSLSGRWALTPPFHPYPPTDGRYVFCGTFLSAAFGPRHPVFRQDSLSCGVRTFLSPHEESGRPLSGTDSYYTAPLGIVRADQRGPGARPHSVPQRNPDPRIRGVTVENAPAPLRVQASDYAIT